MVQLPEMTESIIPLTPTAQLRLQQVFDAERAQQWKDRILSEVCVAQKTIVLFGKQVQEPRLVGWVGDVAYTYSRRTLAPRPMGSTIAELLDVTRRLSGYDFNHALINLYRDGRDSMGMHSDDEPELGRNPVVASWSFGAARKFVLAQKRGRQRLSLILPSGSLLCMLGDVQHTFRHGLPKDQAVCSERVNVTFRQIGRDEPGARNRR